MAAGSDEIELGDSIQSDPAQRADALRTIVGGRLVREDAAEEFDASFLRAGLRCTAWASSHRRRRSCSARCRSLCATSSSPSGCLG